MRPSSLSIGAGAFLALSGVAMTLAARSRDNVSEPPPRHPLTQEMVKAADSIKDAPAPRFTRTDSDGQTVSLATLTKKGPTLLVFILDGCPCSEEAQPFVERLYAKFGKTVTFVGVTNGTTAQAKEWKAHFQMTFPLISNPSKDLMYQFGAFRSAYMVLVNSSGSIAKVWPGYSHEQLTDIDQTLTKESGSSAPPTDFSDAPMKPSTGCAF